MKRKHLVRVIPHNIEIMVEDGNSLLEALSSSSIHLRSECGGKGKCGKCSVLIETEDHHLSREKSCLTAVRRDQVVKIPEESLQLDDTLQKSSASLPHTFLKKAHGERKTGYGIAVDLGTTTIALYLCSLGERRIVDEVHLKNPHGEYGADVMNRISAIAQDETLLQTLSLSLVDHIEAQSLKMLNRSEVERNCVEGIVAVGNPAMIHFLLAINPTSIGVAPYTPAFYSAMKTESSALGFKAFDVDLFTLPQIGGFIGGDIIAAALAAEMVTQPPGTLLIDIGTNGELLLKGKENFFATSCATGPAFEGASISCGVQAVNGAIEQVHIQRRGEAPSCRLIGGYTRPLGICGSGVISAVAELYRNGIIDHSGSFTKEEDVAQLRRNEMNGKYYILWQDGQEIISLSQQDIRSIQLGKGALSTGIEFLLSKAGYERPHKIIVAGAFGTFLEKADIISLGLIPEMKLDDIEIGGNMAGAGAVMALCDKDIRKKAEEIAEKIDVINLAEQKDFQLRYLENLYFSDLSLGGKRKRQTEERLLHFC